MKYCTGKTPKFTLENDWFIGTTGKCPVCNQIKPVNDKGELKRHKIYTDADKSMQEFEVQEHINNT